MAALRVVAVPYGPGVLDIRTGAPRADPGGVGREALREALRR